MVILNPASWFYMHNRNMAVYVRWISGYGDTRNTVRSVDNVKHMHFRYPSTTDKDSFNSFLQIQFARHLLSDKNANLLLSVSWFPF